MAPVPGYRRGALLAGLPVHDGCCRWSGGDTWYRLVGHDTGRPPLVVLHGGPGMPHDYLEPLAALAGQRQVLFYDQLGCGNSAAAPTPAGGWQVATFTAELAALRAELGWARVHLYGQSWGGMLALEYLLARPAPVLSLTLSNSLASTRTWAREGLRLRAALPADVAAVLDRHEADGTTDDPAYAAATMAFYARHVCRLDPWPEYLLRSFDRLAVPVYSELWGPSEFHPTGLLADWDVTGRLGGLDLPTLVLSGEFDESTPAVNAELLAGLPQARWVELTGCSHLPHAEAPKRYLSLLAEFLAANDG